MNILSLDSSGKNASVCILNGENKIYEELLQEGLTHSQTLCPLVEKALNKSGLSLKDIGLFSLSAGPGSFTGLRIGMALVKGMCMPFDIPTAPVSTLSAIAHSIKHEVANGSVIFAALDARRSEVYYGAFLWENNILKQIVNDNAAPAKNAVKALNGKDKPVVFVGDGAEICYNAFDNFKNKSIYKKEPVIAYGAAIEGQNMYKNGQSIASDKISPDYLRLSQAERERMEKLEKANI